MMNMHKVSPIENTVYRYLKWRKVLLLLTLMQEKEVQMFLLQLYLKVLF